MKSKGPDANGHEFSQEGLESLIQRVPLFIKMENSDDVMEVKKIWLEDDKLMADCEYHSNSDTWKNQMMRRHERPPVSMSIRSLAEKTPKG